MCYVPLSMPPYTLRLQVSSSKKCSSVGTPTVHKALVGFEGPQLQVVSCQAQLEEMTATAVAAAVIVR